MRIQKGFTLIVAMLVLLVATLLVVGAIAFTGSESAAAASTFSAEKLSACTEAARNMYLARVQNVFAPGLDAVEFDNTVPLGPNEGLRVRGGPREKGHFTVVTNINGAGVIQSGQNNEQNVQTTDVFDESNQAGDRFGAAGYYRLNATCRDQSTGAEQEIEFYVRLGGV